MCHYILQKNSWNNLIPASALSVSGSMGLFSASANAVAPRMSRLHLTIEDVCKDTFLNLNTQILCHNLFIIVQKIILLLKA